MFGFDAFYPVQTICMLWAGHRVDDDPTGFSSMESGMSAHSPLNCLKNPFRGYRYHVFGNSENHQSKFRSFLAFSGSAHRRPPETRGFTLDAPVRKPRLGGTGIMFLEIVRTTRANSEVFWLFLEVLIGDRRRHEVLPSMRRFENPV